MSDLVPWVFIAAVVAWFWFARRPTVTSERAHELVRNGALLVDVRSPGEFASGHLSGARNVPVGEIAGRTGKLGKKEGVIVLYCASGMRSANAAGILKQQGFANVYNLGAMSNW